MQGTEQGFIMVSQLPDSWLPKEFSFLGPFKLSHFLTLEDEVGNGDEDNVQVSNLPVSLSKVSPIAVSMQPLVLSMLVFMNACAEKWILYFKMYRGTRNSYELMTEWF